MHEDILILHHFYYDTDENDEMGFLDALEFFGGLRIEYFEAFLKVINFWANKSLCERVYSWQH